MKLTWKAPVNAFMALLRVVRAFGLRKPVFLDDATIKARLDKCEGDEHHLKCPWFNRSSRQCTDCQCFVDMKAMLSTESCPRKRWTR